MDATTGASENQSTRQVTFTGPNYGQIAVGDHNVLVMVQHGDRLDALLEPRSPPRLRTPSPRLLPAAFPDLLDREAVLDSAAQSLRARQPLEVHGEPGIGKSSLLRAIAHHALTTAYPDGVIWFPADGRPAPDLLQAVFDALYEWNGLIKPTDAELRIALATRRPLVLIDDVELASDEIERLVNTAPSCTFVVATRERRYWSSPGHSVAISGLPPDEALALFTQRVGRALDAGELDSARATCAALAGHPLRIVQAAAVAEQNQAPKRVAARSQADPSGATLLTHVVPGLPRPSGACCSPCLRWRASRSARSTWARSPAKRTYRARCAGWRLATSRFRRASTGLPGLPPRTRRRRWIGSGNGRSPISSPGRRRARARPTTFSTQARPFSG